MKQIIIFPTGTLSAKDRERITKGGAIAVESDSPEKVVVLQPDPPVLRAEDALMAAMEALSNSLEDRARSTFVASLYRRMKERNP
jgi:hypothetical protein